MTLEKLQKDMIAAMRQETRRERTVYLLSYQQLRRLGSITAAEIIYQRI